MENTMKQSMQSDQCSCDRNKIILMEVAMFITLIYSSYILQF